jgi:hexosaminidase
MSKRIVFLCGLGLWSALMAQPFEPSMPIQKVDDRWAPVPNEPVLIPPPKILWRGEGSPLILPADQKVLLEIEDESYRPAAEALARELARYGLTATIALGEWQTARGIFLGGSRALQRRFPVPDRPGAYMLKVEPPRVLLIGRFAEGVFYGVQTLMQLLQPAPNRLQITPLTIIDYPDMLFRGVHLFGGTQPEFHRRLIGNLVGHLKFNTLVVECGYSQWEAIKPAWVEFSVPKTNLREIVALAQANYLEPIPLLQSLGHMAWVFRNNANVELAEDPETPWAICPRREASRQLLQRLFDEVLEIFPRRAFHLGLDEITLRGRFPHSPECQGATVAQLFSEHFRWLVGELQARGVQEVMLWSDMLLSREEAHDGAANAADREAARFTRQQVLNAIREASRTEGREGGTLTLSLCDWHYTPTEHYRSLEVLRRAGFQRLIATTWYNPRNIYTFAQAARQQRIVGLLQSTWAGYSLTEKSLRDAPEQFIAYVLAAIYAWNSNAPPPEQLPFDVEWFFHARYWREMVPLQPQPGFLVDLRPLYNLRLSELEPVVLSRIPIGRMRLQGHLFQLADSTESPNALMLSSTKAPGEPSRYPREVVIPLAQLEQVKTLYLLHATGWQADRNAEVARLVLEYADGTQAELRLLYGVHVRAWNDPGAAIESPPIWSQLTPDGQRVRLRLLRWYNPHPGKAIRALRLSTTHPTAGYMLLGLSASP